MQRCQPCPVCTKSPQHQIHRKSLWRPNLPQMQHKLEMVITAVKVPHPKIADATVPRTVKFWLLCRKLQRGRNLAVQDVHQVWPWTRQLPRYCWSPCVWKGGTLQELWQLWLGTSWAVWTMTQLTWYPTHRQFSLCPPCYSTLELQVQPTHGSHRQCTMPHPQEDICLQSLCPITVAGAGRRSPRVRALQRSNAISQRTTGRKSSCSAV